MAVNGWLRAGPTEGESPAGQPKGLIAVEQYRERNLDHCEIKWTYNDYHGPSKRTRHFTSRFNGQAKLLLDRGDDEGYIAQDPSGNRLKGEQYDAIDANGDAWSTDGQSVTIHGYPADATYNFVRQTFIDVRAIDLALISRTLSVHDALWKSGIEKRGKISYEEEREGDFHIVTVEARPDQGKTHSYVYTLDPARGWSPVKIEFRIGAEPVTWSRVMLKQYADVWFPETILRYRADFESGRKPTEEIVIDSVRIGVEFPESTFGPKGLGAEVGTNITFAPTRSKPDFYLMWDGTKGIPPDEFRRRRAAGELVFGPNFAKAVMDGATPQGAEPAARVAGMNPVAFAEKPAETLADEWEKYVRAFIRERGLSATQQESAMAILADCKKQAQQYVQSKRPRFNELRKLRDAVRELRSMRAEAGAETKQMKALAEELAKPLDTIFETSLKPRLLGLLTAEQRKAAAPAPTTQPGKGE